MIDLRQAELNDAAELSRIQVDGWQSYEHIFTPAYLASHNTFERRFLYWMNILTRNIDRTYLIEDDGTAVAVPEGLAEQCRADAQNGQHGHGKGTGSGAGEHIQQGGN